MADDEPVKEVKKTVPAEKAPVEPKPVTPAPAVPVAAVPAAPVEVPAKVAPVKPERLINNMMRTEKYTGKKIKTYKVVRSAFEIIEKGTKKNPVQVLVDALSNAAPMEEITRLQFGGISVQKAVDISAARRLDIALRNICKSAVKSTYKNKKPVELCLAEEIILAARGDANSMAVSKKEEIERVAASSR